MQGLDQAKRRSLSAYSASVIRPDAEARRAFERELEVAGRPLQLYHRSIWQAGPGDAAEAGFVGVRCGADPVWGFSIETARSNALPGHQILRVRRLGGIEDVEAVTAGIDAALRFVRSAPRVLRAHVEACSPDPDIRQGVEAVCRARGFAAASDMRLYKDTILLDLSPSVEEMFAGVHKKTRRDVRAVDKNPVVLRPIRESVHAQRMHALYHETMGRTGGTPRPIDWDRVIGFCAKHPNLANVIGLFDDRSDAPEPLLAFALALNHGHMVEYSIAASTRATDLKVPLAYGIAWELIKWGKEVGARWFDFGGITSGTTASPDRLGGISDFKRYFSTNVVEVGAEWVLEPHRMRAAAARRVSRSVRRLKRLSRSFRLPGMVDGAR